MSHFDGRDDVRVLQSSGRVSFTLEAAFDAGHPAELFGQEFQCHLGLVFDVFAEVDGAHAPLGNSSDDLVLAEEFSNERIVFRDRWPGLMSARGGRAGRGGNLLQLLLDDDLDVLETGRALVATVGLIVGHRVSTATLGASQFTGAAVGAGAGDGVGLGQVQVQNHVPEVRPPARIFEGRLLLQTIVQLGWIEDSKLNVQLRGRWQFRHGDIISRYGNACNGCPVRWDGAVRFRTFRYIMDDNR